MRRFLHTIDRISEWSGKVFSWLLLLTAGIISYEIFMRLFGRAQLWVFDITLFSAGVVYVMGGAYTLLHNKHVKMDILYTRLSPRMQALIDLITLPGFLVFCGILFWMGGVRGWESFLMKETIYTAFQPPVWPVRWTIPLGAMLIILQGLAKAIRDFHMVVKGEKLD
ncbi:MAG TPA: TRAP transporter small permease subunit [Dehalococcoidales bacterium]|nr:TRAP transporter small permease subunit [Dehalococcoidales bacterium]